MSIGPASNRVNYWGHNTAASDSVATIHASHQARQGCAVAGGVGAAYLSAALRSCLVRMPNSGYICASECATLVANRRGQQAGNCDEYVSLTSSLLPRFNTTLV
jgi:hypothetical protein